MFRNKKSFPNASNQRNNTSLKGLTPSLTLFSFFINLNLKFVLNLALVLNHPVVYNNNNNMHDESRKTTVGRAVERKWTRESSRATTRTGRKKLKTCTQGRTSYTSLTPTLNSPSCHNILYLCIRRFTCRQDFLPTQSKELTFGVVHTPYRDNIIKSSLVSETIRSNLHMPIHTSLVWYACDAFAHQCKNGVKILVRLHVRVIMITADKLSTRRREWNTIETLLDVTLI